MTRTAFLLRAMSAGLIAGLFMPQAASAQSPVSFQVTLTIQAECRLTSATNLAFGNVGVIQTAVTSTSAIGVQCTNTTPYNIGLNPGTTSGATTATRRMSSTATGSTVQYELFRDAGRTQNWGNIVGTDTLAGTGNGAVQTLTVYGRVPVQTTPAAGDYTDTVQVTVSY